MSDRTDPQYERECDTCNVRVYPTDSEGAVIWLPFDGKRCTAGLHAVHGFADATNTFEYERRTAAACIESAAPTEGTPGVKHPDPNLPSSHDKSCPLRKPDASWLDPCSCGTGILLVAGPAQPEVTQFCERCGLVVTVGQHGTWIDEQSATSDCPNYSGLHRVRGRTRTWAYDSRTLDGPTDVAAKWADLGEAVTAGLAEAAKPWQKLADEIQAGFRKPGTVIARIKEGLPLDDQAFKVGAFGDNIDEASWHRVDPDRPGQSLCGEPSALWPYVMRSALPLLGQPTCSVCDNLVGEVRPYMTASGQLVNLPSGVQPVDVKPLLEHALIAPAGWSAPADQVYDLISNLPPLHEGTDMDHDNDEPTTDAETPEYQAFTKRDEIARLLSQVVHDEIEDELTPEQINDITLAAAEMLLSNYFMREVER